MRCKKKGSKVKKIAKFIDLKQHKNTPFWIFLTALFIISFISLLFYGPQPFTLLTANAAQTISYMKAGSELHSEVRNIEGVQEYTLTFSTDIKNAVILTEEKDVPFDGIKYSSFRIYSGDANKIDHLKLVLKIKESELNSRGISKEDVRLYLNNQELNLNLTRIENDYLYYSAVCYSLGDFVIGKIASKPAAAEEQITIIPESPSEKNDATTEQIPELPLIGKAASSQQSSGLFYKISQFFKNFFN